MTATVGEILQLAAIPSHKASYWKSKEMRSKDYLYLSPLFTYLSVCIQKINYYRIVVVVFNISYSIVVILRICAETLWHDEMVMMSSFWTWLTSLLIVQFMEIKVTSIPKMFITFLAFSLNAVN
uniref:Uncharacterized protein n=1 Tax=Glossina austeni TaxID=7395 RepID=A0A1A9VHG3_GLOAU